MKEKKAKAFFAFLQRKKSFFTFIPRLPTPGVKRSQKKENFL